MNKYIYIHICMLVFSSLQTKLKILAMGKKFLHHKIEVIKIRNIICMLQKQLDFLCECVLLRVNSLLCCIILITMFFLPGF